MLSELAKSSGNLSKVPPVGTRTPGMAQERARSHICYYLLHFDHLREAARVIFFEQLTTGSSYASFKQGNIASREVTTDIQQQPVLHNAHIIMVPADVHKTSRPVN